MSKSCRLYSKERVLCTLQGKLPDRVPKGEIVIFPGFTAKMAAPDPKPVKMEHEVLQRLKADLVVVNTKSPSPQEAIKYWRAESDLFVFAMVLGPLWAGIEGLGWQGLFRLMTGDLPGAVAKIQDLSQRQVDLALSCVQAGAHGVLIADDLAGKDRTLVSPKALREVFFPVLITMERQLKESGGPVAFHSDGNIKAVLDDLGKIGFSAIHGLEPGAGMSLSGARAVVGENATLWGNLEFEGPDGLKSAENVAIEARNMVLENSNRGRYIFGSNTGLYDNVSPELAIAAYEAVEL